MSEDGRLAELIRAEGRALALFDAIEAQGLIAAGRSEREVEEDIYALAERDFGVTTHWHKRICRSGTNTLAIAADNPPVRVLEVDDIVFLDLGPVFGEWEADIGRSYVLGEDPAKRRLCADLSRIFTALESHFHGHAEITGAELFAEAERQAHAAGWLWGGKIAGHMVGEFPHARVPGDKDLYRISPKNPNRMRDPDATGNRIFWILEVHLVNEAREWGGFYERLLAPEPAA